MNGGIMSRAFVAGKLERTRSMRKKKLWTEKLMAAILCAAMAAEPVVIYAEEFSDSFCSENPVPMEQDAAPENVQMPEEVPSQESLDGFVTGIAESAGEGEEGFFSEEVGETDAGIDTEAAPLSGNCGEGVIWSLADGVMTIEGNGAMDDYIVMKDFWTGQIIEEETHREPWTDYKSQIKEIYIKNGVTHIGNRAFCDCSNLTKVVIGDSVKTIGMNAFANDAALTDLTIGNSVEEIRDDAFYGLGITRLVLPASIKTIDGTSLLGLLKLENIEMQDNGSYKSIDGVLYGNQGKMLIFYPPKRTGEYTIPEGVEKIASSAFTYTGLTRLVISDSVKEIEEDAIDHSENLKFLTFGKGAKKIPDRCCFYSPVLEEVTIPEGVEEVGDSAFKCCPSLKSVTLPFSIKNIKDSFDSSTQVTMLNQGLVKTEEGNYISGIWVNVPAMERYDYAFQVLELVNKERAANGVAPLVMDTSLLETAMQRSFESIVYWSHTRPSGEDCFTANNMMFGENIAAWQRSPQGVMDSWMNSSGHRANILSAGYQSIGIGCVSIEGSFYWVQCFGSEAKEQANAASYSNRSNIRKVLVKNDEAYYDGTFKIGKTSLKKGETTTITNLWNGYDLGDSGAVAESSDPAVCSVSGRKVTANSVGTAIITMYYPGYPEKAVIQKITVTKKRENDNGSAASQKCKVTFNANGGIASKVSKTVKTKNKIGDLPKATRAKYTFAGWYTKKSGGTKVTTKTKITKSCTYYAHWKKVTVPKTAISRLTNGKGRRLTVRLKNVKGASGYQIQYSTSPKFSGAKTKTTSKTALTISRMRKNKTYYVRARAYKKDSRGKNVYGVYSAVKKTE